MRDPLARVTTSRQGGIWKLRGLARLLRPRSDTRRLAAEQHAFAVHVATAELFRKAVQLLASDAAITRIGGLEALWDVAVRSEAHRAAFCRTVCAFVRLRTAVARATEIADEPRGILGPSAHAAESQTQTDLADVHAAMRFLGSPELAPWSRTDVLALQGVKLIQAPLAGAILPRADFDAADLSRATLTGADLQESTLRRAALPEVLAAEANFFRANLAEANFEQANLYRANLQSANLEEANFAGAYMKQANLNAASLERCDLTSANLQDASFDGAYLLGVNLRCALGRAASFRGAYLECAHMTRAQLEDADFSGADLQAAELTDASLERANLRDADLQLADLVGANLKGADLTSAKLRFATYDARTRFPDATFVPEEHEMTEVDPTVQHIYGGC